jgi:hypothetical protein
MDLEKLIEHFARLRLRDPDRVLPSDPKRGGGGPDSKVLSVSVVPQEVPPGLTLDEALAAQREILNRGGYNRAERRFDWLQDEGIAHEVISEENFGVWEEVEPNFRLRLKSADLDTARRTAAMFGDALDQAAVGVHLPNSKAPTVRGLKLTKPDLSPFTREDAELLAGVGLQFQFSDDKLAVEFWDYEGKSSDDFKSFARRVIDGIIDTGYDTQRVLAVKGDSFLVRRQEYAEAIRPSGKRSVGERGAVSGGSGDIFGRGGRPSLSAGPHDQLRQAHQEVFGRIARRKRGGPPPR